MFGASGYRYETLPHGYEGAVQEGGLISKVMGLLSASFLFAFIGTLLGMFVIHLNYGGGYWVVAIGGFVVLLVLNFNINTRGLNLFLLFLFTLLEGIALSPLIALYLGAGAGVILAEAFFLTAVTSLGLSVYAWVTKRNFNRLGGILFIGVILLIVAMFLGFFFQSTIFALLISVLGVAIFSAYVLYYVQQAKYLADTMPNAIGLTVSLFITLLNLFLFILRILSIVQGGGGRRS
jgi:modulator of FtsH protease